MHFSKNEFVAYLEKLGFESNEIKQLVQAAFCADQRSE
jgi:hypothetical protein